MKLFLFSPAAEDDLIAIWRYTAENWSADQADRYMDGIRDACHALARGHRQGRPVDVRLGCLKYLIGSQVIYFRDHDDR
ncbi:MAG: type II toxin-antitoxin system RelE/ParE family toxin, partial [Betaproteobacteria bacterium]|nr:type II toxin-antitoxin system RelE/ParE family toxin [Betaproteobacteria bacterium]